MDNRTSYTILGVFFISATFVFGIVITERVDDASTPLISTVLGFGSLILISLMQSHKVDKVDGKVDKVLNGTMDEKIARVVGALLDDRGVGNGSVTETDTTGHSPTDTAD